MMELLKSGSSIALSVVLESRSQEKINTLITRTDGTTWYTAARLLPITLQIG